MGTRGYERAAQVQYRPGEIILEVGTGESTEWLAQLGPKVVTIDVQEPTKHLPGVMYRTGDAAVALTGWSLPIGFAWLDGWDYPYTGVDYPKQRAVYEARGQEHTQEASMASHLTIAERIAGHARAIAFDDTWRTHAFHPDGGAGLCCGEFVPPATPPAPALAMDQGTGDPLCWLAADHPHHVDPDRGWAGKGGTAIPYLISRRYTVLEYGLGLVVLEKENA